MPFNLTGIKLCLSGGAANANPLLSLGGVRSSVEIDPATLFDLVTQSECTNGDAEIRIIYACNDTDVVAEGYRIWLPTPTPSPGTAVTIGLGTTGINGVEPTVGSENAAPAGVTFVAASTAGTALALGDIPANSYRAIVVRRAVTAGAVTYSADGVSLQINGGYTE